jgi:hypothetical protein
VSALSASVAQAVQSGTIDPRAATQLTSGLSDVLSAYEAGHTLGARHGVADLARQLENAQEQGRIAPAAASQLGSGLASLASALLSSAAQTTPAPGQGAPAQAEGAPPGHGGEGPAAVNKHHGDGHRGGEGD